MSLAVEDSLGGDGFDEYTTGVNGSTDALGTKMVLCDL